MNADHDIIPETGTPGDLSRFCLGTDLAESRRLLAWVNSICCLFLLVGLVGLKPAPLAIKRKVSVADEPVPTVIEPVIQAVATITPDAPAEEPSGGGGGDAGGPIVAVTLDSAAVAFSVPTVGNVLVPLGLAQAPPANPMQAAVPVSAATIEQIGSTGIGGSRSAPGYPADALQRKIQGTVVLFIEVDPTGKITAVTIKESSGSVILDRAAADHVKRRWLFGPGGSRQFESPIVFQLK